MCGIVGYLGAEQAAPILLDGLSKLEYRGYDSAGVCISDGRDLKVAKTKGRLAKLSELLDGGKAITGTAGIGHTRWATHGAPSDENSHPHIADSGKIAVVHNGIIENYQQLKEKLLAKGKRFHSETDSEVAANLIEYFYDQGFDFQSAVRKAVDRMEGSYALGILCRDCPDTIAAVKKDSPLIFGFGDGCNFIASDVPAILKHTRKVCYLEDGDMVIFTAHSARFYDAAGDLAERKPEHITWDTESAEKGGYAHFMIKEIHEQPKAIRDTLSPRMKDGEIVLDDLSLDAEYLKSLSRIYIVACGSAYYVGVQGKYILEKLCKIPVEPVLASEFRYADPVLGKDTLVLIISQSGETADTKGALEEAKAHGARTLAIVNVVGSAIARLADDVIYTWAGPEIAVATTKGYTTQVAALYLVGLKIAKIKHTISDTRYSQVLKELTELPDKISRALADVEEIKRYAKEYAAHKCIFFIGRGTDYAASLEGALKLKEISYIHAEAYAAGELKHGTISLIEDGTVTLALVTQSELYSKMLSNIKAVQSRGGKVLSVASPKNEQIRENSDGILLIPDCDDDLTPILTAVVLQVFAYYVAAERGCDIDKPRNLAKSVTVE